MRNDNNFILSEPFQLYKLCYVTYITNKISNWSLHNWKASYKIKLFLFIYFFNIGRGSNGGSNGVAPLNCFSLSPPHPLSPLYGLASIQNPNLSKQVPHHPKTSPHLPEGHHASPSHLVICNKSDPCSHIIDPSKLPSIFFFF